MKELGAKTDAGMKCFKTWTQWNCFPFLSFLVVASFSLSLAFHFLFARIRSPLPPKIIIIIIIIIIIYIYFFINKNKIKLEKRLNYLLDPEICNGSMIPDMNFHLYVSSAISTFRGTLSQQTLIFYCRPSD